MVLRKKMILVWNRRGFSMLELLVLIAIVAIIALIAIHSWLAYGPAATVSGGAREVHSGLSQARMLAISTRQDICVQLVAGGLRFLQGNCAGAAWVGMDTDGAGTFGHTTAVTVAIGGAGASPVFTRFGTARQTATFTVRGPATSAQTVTVWPSGRVTIP